MTMNLKRFTARTSREALAMVRQAFGEDAVVMSTRKSGDGVEVLAMAPESLQQLEKVAAPRTEYEPQSHRSDGPVEQDAERLSMSTLSFQDYVRERMLKRRKSEMREMQAGADAGAPAAMLPALPAGPLSAPSPIPRQHATNVHAAPGAAPPRAALPVPQQAQPPQPMAAARAAQSFTVPLHDEIDEAPPARVRPERAERAERAERPDRSPLPRARADLQPDTGAAPREQFAMMDELRSMRGLIEQRFGALAFMEKLQRQPRQALLSHRLLECGFSPALVRKLVEALPADGDETDWAASVLTRNLATGEAESPLEDVGGVYALIGATGVGKTTSTAKLAAAFAAKHGASNLGLITLDAYRVAAHEQLRAYGRILGVPVHTAHDRASLDDLLELLSGKRMVLIDTAGMAQRDTRTRELLDMLAHRSVNRLLVINASAQGETVEDVLAAYRANTCRGVVLSKIDEAMKLAPALDALIRHKVKVLAVANGQRVPEDWHRLSAQALVQRALRSGGSSAWKLDNNEVSLVFSAQAPVVSAAMAGMPASSSGSAFA